MAISIGMKNKLVQRIDAVVKNDRSVFTNRSQLITYCVNQLLPAIEEELK